MPRKTFHRVYDHGVEARSLRIADVVVSAIDRLNPKPEAVIPK
jgi:hypothetical protein